MGAMIARDAPPALQTMVSALLRTKLELAVAGLDASGKTTLCSILKAPLLPPPPPAPTIGLVVQRARTRGIDVMLWDLGGHHRFRDDWKQHARGCGALLFVVDCSDPTRFGEARQALQRLLEDPIVTGLPLLVLANKVDLLPPADRAFYEVSGWRSLIEQLNLGVESTEHSQRWSVLGVSATRSINLEKVVRWLVLQAHQVGGSSAAEDEEGMPSRNSIFSWPSLTSAWSSTKRRWSSSARYTSVLADASQSLILSERA
mmetsp:Transcript_35/g.118  ORF Transcript_35/g.118 Transcript_35/m.118 type:complete len:259 (+) Transcript_35:65-841(+)